MQLQHDKMGVGPNGQPQERIYEGILSGCKAPHELIMPCVSKSVELAEGLLGVPFQHKNLNFQMPAQVPRFGIKSGRVGQPIFCTLDPRKVSSRKLSSPHHSAVCQSTPITTTYELRTHMALDCRTRSKSYTPSASPRSLCCHLHEIEQQGSGNAREPLWNPNGCGFRALRDLV